MWLILIIAGLALVLFRYSTQRIKERREDRQDRLREMRQQELDRLLLHKKKADHPNTSSPETNESNPA